MAVKRTKHDRVFSNLIRERANWCCDVCGIDLTHEPIRLQCSHFSSRKHLRTRWHPWNAAAQCASCHSRLESRPLEFAEWIKGYLGEERAEYIAWLTNQPAHWRTAERDDIYEWLNNRLTALQVGLDWPDDDMPPHMDLEWHWKKTA